MAAFSELGFASLPLWQLLFGGLLVIPATLLLGFWFSAMPNVLKDSRRKHLPPGRRGTVQVDTMAMETLPPKRNFDLPFRGIPPEIRAMIWQQCIAVAPRIRQKVTWGYFYPTLEGLGDSPCIPLEYDLRHYGGCYITAIAFQDLGIILADKETSAEVAGMLRKQTSLMFSTYNDWDIKWLEIWSKVRKRAMRVTLQIGDPPRIDRDREELQNAINNLDGLQAGSRVYLRLDEILVEVLWNGGMHLQSVAALIECRDFQSAVARCCEEQTRPYSGKILIALADPAMRWHMHWTMEYTGKSYASCVEAATPHTRTGLQLRLLLSLHSTPV